MRLPWIPLKNVIFGLAVPAMVGQTERDSKSSIKDNLNPLYKKRKSKFESLKGTDTKVGTEVGFRCGTNHGWASRDNEPKSTHT